jgi:tellurite resistance protein TehA-like permease
VPLLVAFGVWRHIVRRERLKYTTALWSIVFPLGMFAVATYHFGNENGMPLVALLGQWANWIAVGAWLLVVAGMAATAVAFLRRKPRS